MTCKGKIGCEGGIGKALTTTAAAGFGAFGAAASTAVGAIAGVGMALGKLAIDAAPVEGIRAAFDGVAESAGTTGQAMLEAMKTGSSGMVSARDLM